MFSSLSSLLRGLFCLNNPEDGGGRTIQFLVRKTVANSAKLDEMAYLYNGQMDDLPIAQKSLSPIFQQCMQKDVKCTVTAPKKLSVLHHNF
jgi:hypothetical protein